MVAEIVELDARRPHRSERAACLRCEHEWQAVYPASYRGPFLECPACGKRAGWTELLTTGDDGDGDTA